MGIEGGQAAAVVDDDGVAVAAAHAGVDHPAARSGIDRLAGVAVEVDTGVGTGVPENGVEPGTVRRHDAEWIEWPEERAGSDPAAALGLGEYLLEPGVFLLEPIYLELDGRRLVLDRLHQRLLVDELGLDLFPVLLDDLALGFGLLLGGGEPIEMTVQRRLLIFDQVDLLDLLVAELLEEVERLVGLGQQRRPVLDRHCRFLDAGVVERDLQLAAAAFEERYRLGDDRVVGVDDVGRGAGQFGFLLRDLELGERDGRVASRGWQGRGRPGPLRPPPDPTGCRSCGRWWHG